MDAPVVSPDFGIVSLAAIADWIQHADPQVIKVALGKGDLATRLAKEQRNLGWGKKILGLVIDNKGNEAFAVLKGLRRILQELKKANKNTEVDDPEGGADILLGIDQVQIKLGEFITENDLWAFPVGDSMRIEDRLGAKYGGVCNSLVAGYLIDGLKSSTADIDFFDEFTDGNKLVLIFRRLKELGLLPSEYFIS